MAETLSYHAWAHVESAEFSAGLEVAQRALRLAESANAWDVVFRAVEAVQAVRHKRGADPARNARFILECAAKVREPYARATLLNRAGWLTWEFDPGQTDRLFRESEALVHSGEPTELAGFDYGYGPVCLSDLDRWGAGHAIARKDSKGFMEFSERSYAANWEQQLDGAFGIDVASFVVEAHRLNGSPPPDAALEWLDSAARQATDFWSAFNLYQVNAPLGLFLPKVPAFR